MRHRRFVTTRPFQIGGLTALAMFAMLARPGSAGAAPAQKVTIVAQEWKLVPNEIAAKVGVPLEVTLINRGTIAHNVSFAGLGKTKTILPGEQVSITFTPRSAGTIKFECEVPGHAMVGMRGVVNVSE